MALSTPPLPWRTRVQVVEEAGGRARLAGLGWTAAEGLEPLIRPARPSRATTQQAALLSELRRSAGPARGRCYEAVRGAILACGGYGDLLDLERDERFRSGGGAGERFAYLATATSFVDAVADAGGPESVGLRALPPDPLAAPPGALLVTRSNGHPSCPIDPVYGDLCVLAGVEGGGGWHALVRDTPERDDRLDPLPRIATRGRALDVLARRKLPGRPLCAEVDDARGGTTWLEASALRPLEARLLAFNDGVLHFPADPRRWKSAAWTSTVIAIYLPLDRD